jgi:two-component system, NarL family, invasion response regulator UvrY
MKHLLLADDHSFVRLGLIQIIKDEFPAIEIKEVADTELLINAVGSFDWDLVISDLEMPGRNGLQALEQIKLIKPRVPVLVLSYYTEELYGVRVLKAGGSGYMNKNSAPYELIDAIKLILSGKKYISPGIAEKLITLPNGGPKTHESLSNREFEIFSLLAIGNTITEIAESLSIAVTTVSTHRLKILEKLDLSSNSGLTRYAITHRIISEIYP